MSNVGIPICTNPTVVVSSIWDGVSNIVLISILDTNFNTRLNMFELAYHCGALELTHFYWVIQGHVTWYDSLLLDNAVHVLAIVSSVWSVGK